MAKAKEQFLTVHDARTKFVSKPARSTIHKWVRLGIINRRTKKRVKLAHKMEGGKILISEAAIQAFIAACN